jgi:error-prone DNA polymerase
LSSELASIGDRDGTFPVPRGRGDEAKSGGGPDPRDTLGRKAREIYVQDLHIDQIKVKTRDFR